MKKNLILSFVLMTSIALVGCSSAFGKTSSVTPSSETPSSETPSSEEQSPEETNFKNALAASKASFESENPKLKNIYMDIGDAIHVKPTNFIEGEFYFWTAIAQRFGLWRDENGQYHRAQKQDLLHKYENKIISYEEWAEEMEAKKTELHDLIYSCVQLSEDFIAEAESGQSERNLTLAYETSFAGNSRLVATYTQIEQELKPAEEVEGEDGEEEVSSSEYVEEYIDVEHTYTVTITLGKDLPTRLAYAKDNQTTDAWNFKYGCAEFIVFED